jgi:hypothetical protein
MPHFAERFGKGGHCRAMRNLKDLVEVIQASQGISIAAQESRLP